MEAFNVQKKSTDTDSAKKYDAKNKKEAREQEEQGKWQVTVTAIFHDNGPWLPLTPINFSPPQRNYTASSFLLLKPSMPFIFCSMASNPNLNVYAVHQNLTYTGLETQCLLPRMSWLRTFLLFKWREYHFFDEYWDRCIYQISRFTNVSLAFVCTSSSTLSATGCWITAKQHAKLTPTSIHLCKWGNFLNWFSISRSPMHHGDSNSPYLDHALWYHLSVNYAGMPNLLTWFHSSASCPLQSEG